MGLLSTPPVAVTQCLPNKPGRVTEQIVNLVDMQARRQATWSVAELGMPKRIRGLLEQGTGSRLFTNDQTGRRSGDGDWSKCNARKMHRVCSFAEEERKSRW